MTDERGREISDDSLHMYWEPLPQVECEACGVWDTGVTPVRLVTTRHSAMHLCDECAGGGQS